MEDWNDLGTRELVWRLLTDLNLPLSPLPPTAMNYMHYYYYYNKGGKLNISLFQITILAAFVASKTQECFEKIDSLVETFVQAAQQDLKDDELQILGINRDFLERVKNQNSNEIYDDFRKDLIEAELDFMNAMGWDFPDCNPYEKIAEWKPLFENEFDPESLANIIAQTEDFLQKQILYPDCLEYFEDVAASSLKRAIDSINPEIWQQLKEKIKYNEGSKFEEFYERCE